MLVFDRWYGDSIPGATGLFVEGAVTAAVGVGGALFLFPDQAGLVSIFLCAVASLRTIERQLAWNRARIVDQGMAPLRPNAELVARVLALFAGQLAAFSAVALFTPVDLLRAAFAHQLGPFAGMTFATLAFPSVPVVLTHNLGVLCLFFALALLFRHGGTLIAVAWNASVWGVVFGWLARRQADDGTSLVEAYARVLLGVLPHMLLEACGYVLAGFAGVFLGRALTVYTRRSPEWDTLVRSLTTMLALSVVLVTAGALWEGLVAGAAVRWLRP